MRLADADAGRWSILTPAWRRVIPSLGARVFVGVKIARLRGRFVPDKKDENLQTPGGHTMFESNARSAKNDERSWRREREQLKSKMHHRTAPAVDRWVDEQMFEEDLRAVLLMMRPHRRERLMGWSEYRTGGRNFRATVSWDEEFAADAGTSPDPLPQDEVFTVPNFADVLEALVIGSIRSDAELTMEEECEAYRGLLNELARRVDQRAQCGS
jgi:hypothetical protein